MEQSLQNLYQYAFQWASWLAAFAIEPAEPTAHHVATLVVLSPLFFVLFYFVFQIPMIIGDGLTRNIPVLGILFYRILAFGIIGLVAQLVANGLTPYLTQQGLLGTTLTPAQIKYGIMGLLAAALILNSYKKLENLLSATFYWKRRLGLLDALALGVSAWLILAVA